MRSKSLTDFGKPLFKTNGLLFHVATIYEGIPDGPRGIWLNQEYLQKNEALTLRTVHRDNIVFNFVVVDPLLYTGENAPIRSMMPFTYQSALGSNALACNVKVELYAEWNKDIEDTKALIGTAFQSKEIPSEINKLTHRLLSEGLICAREFISIMRKNFDQYWLIYPGNIRDWNCVHYLSVEGPEWYFISTDEAPEGWPDMRKSASGEAGHKYILPKTIDPDDIRDINGHSATEQNLSFADEMISTALVELSADRLRSSIIHADIALENIANEMLEKLISEQLTGLEEASILEAISKEVSLDKLARIVFYHSADNNKPAIDWEAIKTLHETRNTIVHKKQRRLPPFDILQKQILEIYKYVRYMDELVRSARN